MFQGKLLRVDLPWASASAFVLGWMGDGGSDRDSRKRTT